MATLTTSGKRKPAQVVVRATVRVHVEGTATRDEVIDAGLEAGFQNASHFARTFRKLVGVTPRRFRGA